MKMSMTLKETKGDVRFYQNEEGRWFQQLFDQEIEPVLDGAIQYREIKHDHDYVIRYELNGSNGFSVWSDGGVNYQDNLWTLTEAEDYILENLPRCCAHCKTLVYLQQTPEWEICSACGETFCNNCIDWKDYSESEGPICQTCAN